MRVLQVILNRFIMTLIIIVVGLIPFFIFLSQDIKYGAHSYGDYQYALRYQETFLALAFTVGASTALVEIGKLLPIRLVNAIFGFAGIVVGAFMALYVFMDDYSKDFSFFHAMCSWGTLLYPILYILLRKKFNSGFYALACPFIVFGACMLFGLIPALIGNIFIAFKLPFILVLAWIGYLIYRIVHAGWDFLATSYYEFIGHLPHLGGSNKESKEPQNKDKDKYDQRDEVIAAVQSVESGYYSLYDIDYVDNEVFVTLVRKSGWEGEYSESVYQDEKYALKYRIENAVMDAGYHRPIVTFR